MVTCRCPDFPSIFILISPQSLSPAHASPNRVLTHMSNALPHISSRMSHQQAPPTPRVRNKTHFSHQISPQLRLPAGTNSAIKPLSSQILPEPRVSPAPLPPAPSKVSAEYSSLQPHRTLFQDLFVIGQTPARASCRTHCPPTVPSPEAPTLLGDGPKTRMQQHYPSCHGALRLPVLFEIG